MDPAGRDCGGIGSTENDGGVVPAGGAVGDVFGGVAGGVDGVGVSPVSLTVGTVPAPIPELGPSSPQPKRPTANGKATRAAATSRR